jgi:hypothetical protein
MGTTSNFAFRYPDSTSSVNVPSDMQNLATDLDTYIANKIKPRWVVKPSDESLASNTTAQDDDHLLVAVLASTTYEVQAEIFFTEAAGTSSDFKVQWTFPAGCRLDLGVSGPHESWVPGAGAALEAEWAAWSNETASPSSSKKFGTSNVAVFTLRCHGTLQVGVTAGTFRLQWAQGTSNASATTVKGGSSLILRPLPA